MIPAKFIPISFTFLLSMIAVSSNAQPENSYQVGSTWYCNSGYKRSGDQCVKFKVPENAWVQGSQWYCNSGYKRSGDQCVKLKVPANAWVQGSQWYCNSGYKRSGDQCVKFEVPANAWVQGSQWYCNNGYKRTGDQCVKFRVPANASAQGSQWYCNIGYKRNGQSCVEMTAQEKAQQQQMLKAVRSVKSQCRTSENAGFVVKEDVCGSGNAIIETTDGWFVAAEHYSGVYLYEGDIVCGNMKTYGFQELHKSGGSDGRFYIEDWESDISDAYEELCD